MKKTIFTLLTITLCTSALMAQTSKHGHIEITGDVLVDQLVKKHIEFNEQLRTVPGFRIQIASLSGTNSKSNAFNLKEQVSNAFPEQQVYVIYDEPNFRVKVGDFRTRLEAYAFLQQLKPTHPGTIVKDNIYPIPLDPNDRVPETDADAEY